MERLDSPPFFLLAEKLRTKYWEQSSVRCVFPDAHAVEGTVDEKKGDQEKSRREDVGQCCAVLCRGQLHGELDGEQAEERRELADGMEFDVSESQCGEKYRDENVQHAFLRVLGANLDDFLAVRDAGGSGSFELDIGFDEFNRAVSAGGYRLRASASEPVNHGATGDQAQH